MMDRGEKTVPAGSDLSLKKKELLSSAMKRTSEWYASCLLKLMLLWLFVKCT